MMETKEKIALIEEMLELEEGLITLETALEDLEEWDSIASLSLVILLDENFNKNVTGREIKALKTIGDIVELMG